MSKVGKINPTTLGEQLRQCFEMPNFQWSSNRQTCGKQILGFYIPNLRRASGTPGGESRTNFNHPGGGELLTRIQNINCTTPSPQRTSFGLRAPRLGFKPAERRSLDRRFASDPPRLPPNIWRRARLPNRAKFDCPPLFDEHSSLCSRTQSMSASDCPPSWSTKLLKAW